MRELIAITYNGVTQSLQSWAKELGMNDSKLDYRIRQGWPVEDALYGRPKGPKRKPIRHPDRWEIPLSDGRSAFVDLDCPPWILEKDWHPSIKGRYASTYLGGGRKNGKKITLHKAVLGEGASDGDHTDHIDGDGLNNLRGNLRVCTPQQNAMNQGGRHRSRYRGVSATKDGHWRAKMSVTVNGRRVSYAGGVHPDEESAARAVDSLARKHLPEDLVSHFRFNFPDH